jgi:hypothetical protein
LTQARKPPNNDTSAVLDSPQPAAVAMNCHLLVPNLFWPATAGVAPYAALALPALEMMLARGARARLAGCCLERWLAAAFHVDPTDASPLAPLALRGDGVEPGSHCWITADPVHLKVHGAHVILAEASRYTIARQEADELVAALNAHFGARGIAFIAPTPQRWYARIAAAPRIRTVPTAEVAGRPIEDFLPQDEDGASWRAILNEAQMLLHQHPCNEQREARGELPVNSVWFWGAGCAPSVAADPPYRVIWSDHPLASGLAAASSAEARALPRSGQSLLGDVRTAPRNGTHLVVLEIPPAMAYGDIAAWREAVLALEENWLAPLLAGLWGDVPDAITLHALGRDFSYTTALTRRDRYRFWRRRRPLLAYIG